MLRGMPRGRVSGRRLAAVSPCRVQTPLRVEVLDPNGPDPTVAEVTGGQRRTIRAVTSVIVRPAAGADIPQLLALVRRYWEFEHLAGFEALRIELLLQQLIADPHLGAAWVAEAQGRLAGYLLAVTVLSLEHGGLMAEIDEFFVLPEARTQGVGSQLLAAAEAALAARGCVRLQLQLATGNAAARDFCQRRGYRARDGYRMLDRALQPSAAAAGVHPEA